MTLQSGGYSVNFSLFELFLSILGMVMFAFLGSYWGVLAGNIKRDKDIEGIKDRVGKGEAALILEVAERKEGDREIRASLSDMDEGLTDSVNKTNERIDRWIENRWRGGGQT